MIMETGIWAFVIIGLAVWAYRNTWSENDTQNFSQAARHGSRMKR